MPFAVEFSRRARHHLKDYRKRDQQVILKAIVARLTDEPEKETRNRKKLEENELAPWELRVGDFRVFYDVDTDAECVIIVAIGHKVHNTLWIAGEEVEL
jgi:mRNA-degrading endonuclease RelE of RelBE toxin-antitoxin system